MTTKPAKKQTKPRTKRGDLASDKPPAKKAAKNTPITTITEQLARNPKLSMRELGKLNGIDHTAVVRLLQRHGIQKDHIEGFKTHRADLLAGMQEKVLACITDEDIKRASLRDKVIAAATLFDKERLERGLSTNNTAVIYASAVEGAFKEEKMVADKSDAPQDVVVPPSEAPCSIIENE